jgi:hypothetical protein
MAPSAPAHLAPRSAASAGSRCLAARCLAARCRGVALFLGLVLCLVPGGRSLAAEPRAPAAPGWTWEVTPSADLARLSVKLCFRGFLPKRLVLPIADGATALRPLGPAGGARLVPQDGGWGVEGSDAFGCVAYDVDVAELVRGVGAERVGRDLLTQPGAWLLVPALFTASEDARMDLRLPQGLSASLPWPADASGVRRIPETAFLFESRVAFGRFTERRITVAGAAFDVAVLDGPHAASEAGIDRWLDAAGRCVATLYGDRFPEPRVQVLVEPVEASRQPVSFGLAMQAGGASVRLFLSAAAKDGDLPLEWIAVHELTHLAMPWIVAEDAWLREGLATWYQETLRGRVGFYGDEGAWRAIDEGFGRGRRQESDRSLADDSRNLRQRHAYMRVYWAGAALAMRIDLALRAETQGRLSLDDVMRLWAGADIRARRGWQALDLLAEADRRLGTRACVASVRGALAASEFPRTDDLWLALGIGRDEHGAFTFSADPEARRLRRAVAGGTR